MKKLIAFVSCFLIILTAYGQKKDHQIIEVKKSGQQLDIDAEANEDIWQKAEWHPMDQLWVGSPVSKEDFDGRYKLAWDEDYLYLLVEITDDILYDQHEEPLNFWWDDDCVEVFIDEDNSGGEHQYNYNAFAYHISLDFDIVDMGTDEKGHLFNDHILVNRKTEGNTTFWEMAINLYDKTYSRSGPNTPVELSEGKKIGFALAYCDNDESRERENFIGSVYVPGEDKNRGWIDAGIFGTLVLRE